MITGISEVNVKDIFATLGYNLTATLSSTLPANSTVQITGIQSGGVSSTTNCSTSNPCNITSSPTAILTHNSTFATDIDGHSTTFEVKITIPANTNVGNYTVDIAYDETPIAIAKEGDPIQNISAATCPTDETKVYDTRDNHYYLIKKMADNECWMLTNLAYGEATDQTTTYSAGIEFTSGAGTTDSACAPSDTVWCRKNPPANHAKQWLNPANPNITGTQCAAAYSTSTALTYDECGYLYNWCAALGTASAKCANTANGTDIDDAGDGLCPAGWRLPASGEFQALHNTMGGVANNWLPSGIWRGVYSGSFSPGYGVNYQGVGGNYWSATVDSSESAYSLDFGSSSVNPVGSNVRFIGFAVRCIASS
ncbi:MAG: fibrobacter succinogenes major paralogous domain-containing protein [Candidatus Nomurabacteria bacterium]|nr:fibrobacter succinogenes major paralogous domain-containing protein [Candidatus Nomurabacteria bacterium]